MITFIFLLGCAVALGAKVAWFVNKAFNEDRTLAGLSGIKKGVRAFFFKDQQTLYTTILTFGTAWLLVSWWLAEDISEEVATFMPDLGFIPKKPAVAFFLGFISENVAAPLSARIVRLIAP